MDNRQRYFSAVGKMQAGVAMEMHDPARASATEPKHLRVGINSAMSDQMGLVKLLIAKGLFTEEEYIVAIADAMEEEVKSYEERLTKAKGVKIILGGTLG